MSYNPRLIELLDWAVMAGIELPMPPEEILALEDDGHTVDLRTGEIIIDGANHRYTTSAAGEAELFVFELLKGENL